MNQQQNDNFFYLKLDLYSFFFYGILWKYSVLEYGNSFVVAFTVSEI
jgi:hypothetical protein